MTALPIGQFEDDRPAIDHRVREVLDGQRPIVAFSISGGKDGTAAMHAVMTLLDEIGHPRDDRVAIHADLGRAEWRSTPDTVERLAAYFAIPLMVVRRQAGDMVQRWEARFSEGKRRYANLEVFNLIGPWSSASLRFCTAELKQQVIAPALRRAFPGRTILSVLGIRRQESAGRANAPISKPEPRWNQRDGTNIVTWNPGVEWTAASVFARHGRHALPLHEAYQVWGCSRVSCAFCVMQSAGDQAAAAKAPGNRGLLLHLIDLEARSTFSFQPGKWLADVDPRLLTDGLRADVARAKELSAWRASLEAALAPGLRYVKGWPPRAPSHVEAVEIVDARSVILGHHGLPVLYPTPQSVIARFEELMAAEADRAGKTRETGSRTAAEHRP